MNAINLTIFFVVILFLLLVNVFQVVKYQRKSSRLQVLINFFLVIFFFYSIMRGTMMVKFQMIFVILQIISFGIEIAENSVLIYLNKQDEKISDIKKETNWDLILSVFSTIITFLVIIGALILLWRQTKGDLVYILKIPGPLFLFCIFTVNLHQLYPYSVGIYFHITI